MEVGLKSNFHGPIKKFGNLSENEKDLKKIEILKLVCLLDHFEGLSINLY